MGRNRFSSEPTVSLNAPTAPLRLLPRDNNAHYQAMLMLAAGAMIAMAAGMDPHTPLRVRTRRNGTVLSASVEGVATGA